MGTYRTAFAERDAETIDPETRRAAELTRTLCCAELGLPLAGLRWLDGTGLPDEGAEAGVAWLNGDLSGCVQAWAPGSIFVRAGASVDAVIVTVAHEARHLWQIQRAGWEGFWRRYAEPRRKDAYEADAEEYGRAMLARLG